MKLDAGDMDLVWDAVKTLVEAAASGNADVDTIASRIVGIIDLAAHDEPSFKVEVKRFTSV